MKKFFDLPKFRRDDPEFGDPNERTLVIIKGDAIARGLVGAILAQIEKMDLKVVSMKTIKFTEELLNQFYGEHKEADFFPKLQRYILYAHHIAIILQGREAINKMLRLKGRRTETDKGKTLRKQFALDSTISTIHCSDNTENAIKEIAALFSPTEIPQEIPDMQEYQKMI